jgi:hypothetical protein
LGYGAKKYGKHCLRGYGWRHVVRRVKRINAYTTFRGNIISNQAAVSIFKIDEQPFTLKMEARGSSETI